MLTAGKIAFDLADYANFMDAKDTPLLLSIPLKIIKRRQIVLKGVINVSLITGGQDWDGMSQMSQMSGRVSATTSLNNDQVRWLSSLMPF